MTDPDLHEPCEKKISLLFQIARLAGEGQDLSYFHSRCLELIARHYDWLIGQLWLVNEEQSVVTCASPWYAQRAFPEFRQASRDRRFSKGVGLPGRVWGTHSAIWLEDVRQEQGMSFPRAAVALKSGLLAGAAFPITNGSKISAVYEYFWDEPTAQDPNTMIFFDKLGKFIGTYMAEKEAIELLYQNDVTNRVILDKACNGFIAIDHRGVIINWTQRTQTIFGWEKHQVLNRPLAELIIPERYREAHIKGIFRVLTTGDTKISNKRIRTPALHKDGHEISIELTIFPIYVLDRTIFGAFIADLSQPLPTAEIVLT